MMQVDGAPLETRYHVAEDGTASQAIFSTCGLYRYGLSRRWGDAAPLTFVMLNPSKADEKANDPTIARCEKRARMWGFGGIEIVNLFALRATRPEDLRAHDAPEGPANRACLCAAVARAGLVLAGWGVHGTHRGQDARILDALRGVDLHVLGLTRHGHPRHPLYVGYASKPIPWSPPSHRIR